MPGLTAPSIALALALTAVSAVHAAPAAPAAPAPLPPARDDRGLQLIASSAAAVLRADPAELERAADLVRSFGGETGLAASLVSLASAGAVGFDPLSRAGWRSAGLDPDRPVFAALAPADPTAPRAVWHVRAVVRIADPRAFAEWAVRVPILGQPWHPDRPGRPLAALLGIDPTAEAAAARALTERGTVAAGTWPSLGALLFIRRAGGYAVVDGFAPAALARLTWAQDGAWILAQLDPPRPSLAERATAAARVLSRPGLALWIQPAGMLDAALTWSRPAPACSAFRDVAPRTALTDGAVSLRVGPHQLAVELTLSAAPGAPFAAAWPTTDDGLAGSTPRAGAILSASIFLAGTDRLRALPRPALVDGGWGPLWRRARYCGRATRAVLVGFAWPELVSQWLREIAAVAPQAAALVGSLRNVGFTARRVSAGDRREWDAVLEASLAPGGQAPAGAILDAVFGGRTAARRPRPHTVWAGNALHPYTLSRGPRGAIVGVALGDRARRWRLDQPNYRPRRAAAMARARGDAGALLRQLAPGLAGPVGALGAAAAPRVGSFDAEVTVHPDALRLAATIRRR